MHRPDRPFIIDIEASGFGSHSYPIEVGLALEPGQRYCSLIKPIDEWQHWDRQAESVHQITRDTLFECGHVVKDVAADLNQRLHNKVVYSDGWAVDNAWIIRLFEAARMEMAFSVSALEMILTEQQMSIWHDTRDIVIKDLGLDRHRASNDSWIIQETYIRTRTMAS